MHRQPPAEEAEFDRVLVSPDPPDPVAAERNPKEVRQVLDETGVAFFRQLQCHGGATGINHRPIS